MGALLDTASVAIVRRDLFANACREPATAVQYFADETLTFLNYTWRNKEVSY